MPKTPTPPCTSAHGRHRWMKSTVVREPVDLRWTDDRSHLPRLFYDNDCKYCGQVRRTWIVRVAPDDPANFIRTHGYEYLSGSVVVCLDNEKVGPAV